MFLLKIETLHNLIKPGGKGERLPPFFGVSMATFSSFILFFIFLWASVFQASSPQKQEALVSGLIQNVWFLMTSLCHPTFKKDTLK